MELWTALRIFWPEGIPVSDYSKVVALVEGAPHSEQMTAIAAPPPPATAVPKPKPNPTPWPTQPPKPLPNKATREARPTRRKNELNDKILELLQTGPARAVDLAETIGCSRENARMCLERLREKRLVTREQGDDGRIVYLLRVDRRSNGSAAPPGAVRSKVLALLEKSTEELTAKDISDRTGISSNTMGATLSVLTRLNLVSRRKPLGGGHWLYQRKAPSVPHVPHLNGATKEAEA